MGEGMARNLAKAGLLSVIWNRTAEKITDFSQELGVTQAASLQELAQQCELIITSVSADEDLEQVVQELLPVLNEQHILVDTSTVAISTVKQIAHNLSEKGVRFMDAPVSGGIEGANKGTMVMMLGGEESTFRDIQPVLQAISKEQILMGPVGSGQATKAVNQIMAAGINQAVSESLAFASSMDLDMDKVIQVISQGAAGNWFLQHRGQTMTSGKYDPGFKVKLHHKDLSICREIAESMMEQETRLPLVEMTLIHYQRLINAGFGEEDISSLYRVKQDLFKEKHKRKF
jgi:3-hydroxyisobutyrate dehydrogenase